jgi:DNA-binding response OmpR family regulator
MPNIMQSHITKPGFCSSGAHAHPELLASLLNRHVEADQEGVLAGVLGTAETGKGARVRVLVAEDERLMADTIAEGLRRRSMAVDVCYDGDAALERVTVHRYDVVVLDRDLPKVHGDEVCRRIVAAGVETGVLMLTAAAGIRDRVDGLDLGADDYLTKPFAFAELAAHVGALGRRARRALPPVLERAGIRLDRPRHSAWRDGLLLSLSPKEFAVGLGLSIVRSIVAAHEGTVRARPRPEGGLIVEIEFPDLSVTNPRVSVRAPWLFKRGSPGLHSGV